MNPVARALLLTILIAGFIGGGLWLLVPDRSGLRSPALAFFETWWDGEPTGDALAKDFDGAASNQAFEDLRKYWRAILGRYDGPEGVLSEAVDATHGSIIILLNFEKGTAEGHFDFIAQGDLWKLKNFRLEPKTGAIADAPKGNPKRIARKLVEFWAQDQWRTMWEMFEPDLRRQYPPDSFALRTDELTATLGSFKEVVVSEQASEDEKTLHSSFSVEFEKGALSVTSTLVRIGGQWRLTAFAVEGWDQ